MPHKSKDAYREYMRKWRARNLEKLVEYGMAYYRKNLDHMRARYRAAAEIYGKKHRDRVVKRQRRRRVELSDCYVRWLICPKAPAKDIPAELLDLYRKVVLLKRAIKETTNGNQRSE